MINPLALLLKAQDPSLNIPPQNAIHEVSQIIEQSPQQNPKPDQIASLGRRKASQKQEPKKNRWWLFLVGMVLTTAVILACVYYYFLQKSKSTVKVEVKVEDKLKPAVAVTEVTKCDTGYFLHNGKCIKCPDNFDWNGTQCIIKKAVLFSATQKKQENTSQLLVSKKQQQKQKIQPEKLKQGQVYKSNRTK